MKTSKTFPQLRGPMSEITDNYHNVQQNVMETLIDRGQLRRLAEPTIFSNRYWITRAKLH